MRWHRVEVVLTGPGASEADNSPNPFLDYRLDCTFTAPSGAVTVVPGFFDSDGAGGSQGSQWKCRFAPAEVGLYSYRVSFRGGNDAAISSSATAGVATGPNGESGTFEVFESDKAGDDFRAPGRGFLRNPGGHYLKFDGGAGIWIKSGLNIPENLLGYTGFDNTPGASHSFPSHAADWRPGDPDWDGGQGRAIIGALNYMAGAGGNVVYFLPMNVGGDGNDVFPTLGAFDRTHYDTSKLAQWERVFEHADKLGIFLHFVLAEAGSVETYHDGGELGPQRKLYYRELIARFGHHPGIEWNLGEENNYGTNRLVAFAEHIRAVDPYDHPITTHTKFDDLSAYYSPLLGNPLFSITSFQMSINRIKDEVPKWRSQSAAAGAPWVISVDEGHPIENDPVDEQRGYPAGRRIALWPTMIGGGGGFEWYIKNDGGGDSFDQAIEDFRQTETALRWSRYIREFLAPLPLDSMTPGVGNCGNGCMSLGQSGRAYALYRPSSASISLNPGGSSQDRFFHLWFDPEFGTWHPGGIIQGGGTRSLGSPPFSGDMAAIVMRDDLATAAGFCVSDADCIDADSCLRGATCNNGTCGQATPDHSVCDNGLFCDGSEICDADTGSCIASAPIDCDDGLPCTVEICDEALDVCRVGGTASCDNGLFCDGQETCDANGECIAGTPPRCDDGIACTRDSCSESAAACIHDADDALCDDGSVCTDDVCNVQIGCDFGYNTAACDDGLACTIGDICTAGVCLGGDACPVGQQCNLSSGACERADERIWIAAATDTTAMFSGAMTSSGRYALGDDLDPAADGLLGIAIYADSSRNDFSGASGDEVTYTVFIPHAGQWYLWARLYYPGQPNSNEANSFFVRMDGGAALPLGNKRAGFRKWHWDGDGRHSNRPVAPLALGWLDAGLHQLSVLKREVQPLAPRLDVLTLSPDPAAPSDAAAFAALVEPPTTTTLPPPGCVSDAECSDGLFCNGAERCATNGECRSGTAPRVDDGIPCTIDSCNEALGRVDHRPDDTRCDDGNICTAGTCEAASGCVQSPTEETCDDGISCTSGDRCAAGVCRGTDACGSAGSCNRQIGQCVANDTRVWIAAATDATAVFEGQMQAGAGYSVGDDADAAADSLIGTTVFAASSTNSFSGGSGDAVSYDFELPVAGNWYLWARLYYPADPGSNGANSFWARVDNGPLLKVGNNRDLQSRWHWDGDGGVESGAPVALSLGNLPAGMHRLRIEKREVIPVPPRLDVLLLTLDASLPSDGDAVLALFAPTTTTLLPPIDTTTVTTPIPTSTTTTLEPDCFIDADCSDRLFCNGAERCLAAGICAAGVAPVIDDGVDCTVDRCNEELDRVDHIIDNEFCSDNDVCTNDVCLVPLGCVHNFNTAPCDDGLACTVSDECATGTCHGVTSCSADEVCSAQSGVCESADRRVWIATASAPSAVYNGAMKSSSQYAGGSDDDPVADSLGDALVFADTGTGTFSGGTADHALYNVAIPESGNWYLWARLYYPGRPGSNDANSFLVRIDNGAYLKVGNNKERYRQWHWDGDGSVEVGAVKALSLGFLNRGEHSLRLEKREVSPISPRIEAIVLTPDPTAVPTDADAVAALFTEQPEPPAPGCLTNLDCDDAVFCNGPEVCLADGTCRAGVPPQVDDGVACTSDACNEELDRVEHLADDRACSDGSPCTSDVCDAGLGCTHSYNTAPCDDGLACTAGDTCSAGRCVGQDACGEGSSCDVVTGTCETARPVVWVDAAGDPGAVFTGAMTHNRTYADGSDADPVLDSLLPRLVYSASDTNDFNATGADSVTYPIVLPSSGDWYLWARLYYPGVPGGNSANSFYVRVDGGSPIVLGNDSSKLQSWHWDGSGGRALALGNLSAGSHTLMIAKREVVPDAPRVELLMLSPDANRLPTDAEALAALPPRSTTTTMVGCLLDAECDDAIACTVDRCMAGECVSTPSDVACSNGSFCDGQEICDIASGCVSGVSVDVDDGVPCTLDLCDEVADDVVHLINHAACDDGDVCTSGVCDPTFDCVHVNNSAPCDDGDPCTTQDRCNSGVCSGTPSCFDTDIEIDPTSITDSCEGATGSGLRIGSVSVGNQPNRVLVVTLAGRDDDADCDFAAPGVVVSYRGRTLAHAASAFSAFSGSRVCNGLFYLVDPPSGTGDVLVSMAGAIGNGMRARQGGAFVLYNVAQRSPAYVLARGMDSDLDPVITEVTTESPGAWVVDVISQNKNGSFLPLVLRQTIRWQGDCGNASTAASTMTVATPGSPRLAWTHDDPRGFSQAVAVFAPVGSAARLQPGADRARENRMIDSVTSTTVSSAWNPTTSSTSSSTSSTLKSTFPRD